MIFDLRKVLSPFHHFATSPHRKIER